MQPSALLIVGLAYTDYGTGVDLEIDGVTVMQPVGGIITDTDPAANITVVNSHAWEVDEDARVVAAWNENTEQWEALQITCPS